MHSAALLNHFLPFKTTLANVSLLLTVPLLPAQVVDQRGSWKGHVPHDEAETNTKMLPRFIELLTPDPGSPVAFAISEQMFVTGSVSFYQLCL